MQTELPEQVRKSLAEVIDYLWNDEERHYNESYLDIDEDGINDHIFNHVVALSNFLYDKTDKPEDFLEDGVKQRSIEE